VSPSELAALARRHTIAVTMILLVAAGAAFTFKHTLPTYSESATVIVTAPDAPPYTAGGSTVLTTAEVMVNWIMGPQGQQQIHQAGVDNGFDAELLNFANMQYPYYVEPYLVVSASAHDPAAAHRAFTIVTRIVNDYLAALQRQKGVTPDNLMRTDVIGDTGPLIQQGSSKRSFAGLFLLTIVAAYLMLRFLDHHPVRPRALLRSQLRSRRDPAVRDPLVRPGPSLPALPDRLGLP
jgi:hypothetical protein